MNIGDFSRRNRKGYVCKAGAKVSIVVVSGGWCGVDASETTSEKNVSGYLSRETCSRFVVFDVLVSIMLLRVQTPTQTTCVSPEVRLKVAVNLSRTKSN